MNKMVNLLKKKSIFLLITVILLILPVTGCKDDKEDTGAEVIVPEDSYEEPEDYLSSLEDAADTDEESKRVGVAMPTRTSERWINDGMSMKAKLETLGYEVDLQYADDDIELQVSQIKNMLSNGANCLVVASIDSTRLTEVLGEAKRSGIPVIAYDRLLMDTDAVSYYASFDNKAIGTLIGEYIVKEKDLEKARKEGRSYTIEFFMGSPDDNNAIFLYSGVMEVLKPYLDDGTLRCLSGRTSFEETCILRWSEDTAKENCLSLLDEFYMDEKLDIACSAFDRFGYGIIAAYGKMGIDDLPLITGQDAEKPAIRNIVDGKMNMTIYKDSRLLAGKCVTMVQALLEGIEPEINDTTQYNNNVLTVPSYLCEPVIIDKDNYEEILIGGGYYTKEQLFK